MLGLRGIPVLSETLAIQRDIHLLQHTASRLHIAYVSAAASADLIRHAKKATSGLSCAVSPFHLLYAIDDMPDFDADYKLFPPLRTPQDRSALIQALEDGTVDAIASFHMPQNEESKKVEFEYAAFGAISIQTVFSTCLQALGAERLEVIIRALTEGPRKVLGLEAATIKEGSEANLTIFSPEGAYVFNEQVNASKSVNSPLFGKTLSGRVGGIIQNGDCLWNL
jgi:dihydroorotase